MTRVDLIDDWSAPTTGTFTFDGGKTVSYSVSTPGASYNGSQSHLVGDWDANHSGLGLGRDASIEFDEAVAGFSVDSSHWGGAETIQFTVDGVVINLQDAIASGDVTITGSDGSNGTSSLDANGRIYGPNMSNAYEVITVTFNVPVKEVLVSNIGNDTATSTGDFYLESSALQPCFTAGTLIATDQGLVAVEALQAGDMINTKDHGFQPVKWVGASRVYASGFDVPLRIKKGTFGNTRDLVVSKRHKMLMDHTHLSLMFDVEEAFACAMHLRNDDTIVREPEGG